MGPGTAPSDIAPSIVLRGDSLDVLRPFSDQSAVVSFDHPAPVRRHDVRTVVTAIDLTALAELSVAAFERRLQSEERVSRRACDALPRLAHLVIVVAEPTHLPADASLAAADRVAERLSRHLELFCGASVAVTVLLVSACSDATLLARRIRMRVRVDPIDSHLALAWADLSEEDIVRTSFDLTS